MKVPKESPTKCNLKRKLPGKRKPGIKKRVMLDLTQIFFPSSASCEQEEHIIRCYKVKENYTLPWKAKKVGSFYLLAFEFN